MNTYIALLRGINVAGQKKVLMADLKSLLIEAGFSDVKTYIQSGNLAFQSNQTDKKTLASEIERIIESAYSFHAPTLVLSHQYIQSVLEENPFSNEADFDRKKTYFSFLYSTPNQNDLDQIGEHNFSNEEIRIHSNMAYLYLGNGAGKAKLTTNFIEKKLNVTSSARNYNTVVKLLEMSN